MRDPLAARDDATALLRNLVAANRRGEAVGIFSICSANRLVLEAGMIQALRDDTVVCIESTSNQVNQFGGYTGMTPGDFRALLSSVAAAAGLPETRIILGGDHLGPHVWRDEPAATAMAKARDLVRTCVLAGYTKIHLDASTACADDRSAEGARVTEAVATERAVDLCRAAETAHAELPPGSPPPVYVIGTEVPPPGGAEAVASGVSVTPVAEIERTLRHAAEAFRGADLQSAWERVIAVVVQPGVEFGDATVFEYDRTNAGGLSAHIERHRHLVYEAHSTDYQSAESLRHLVEDHFAILKVGPALTFALREAVFALELIEREWLAGKPGVEASRVREVLDETMVAHPQYWLPYYHGTAEELRFARAFSRSDRCRYYWPYPEVQAAMARLLGNLSEGGIPLPLLSQYLPAACRAVRRGALENEPTALIRHRITEVLDMYAAACRAG